MVRRVLLEVGSIVKKSIRLTIVFLKLLFITRKLVCSCYVQMWLTKKCFLFLGKVTLYGRLFRLDYLLFLVCNSHFAFTLLSRLHDFFYQDCFWLFTITFLLRFCNSG